MYDGDGRPTVPRTLIENASSNAGSSTSTDESSTAHPQRGVVEPGRSCRREGRADILSDPTGRSTDGFLEQLQPGDRSVPSVFEALCSKRGPYSRSGDEHLRFNL